MRGQDRASAGTRQSVIINMAAPLTSRRSSQGCVLLINGYGLRNYRGLDVLDPTFIIVRAARLQRSMAKAYFLMGSESSSARTQMTDGAVEEVIARSPWKWTSWSVGACTDPQPRLFAEQDCSLNACSRCLQQRWRPRLPCARNRRRAMDMSPDRTLGVAALANERLLQRCRECGFRRSGLRTIALQPEFDAIVGVPTSCTAAIRRRSAPSSAACGQVVWCLPGTDMLQARRFHRTRRRWRPTGPLNTFARADWS
jgi:hypothetical protein